MKGNSIFFKIAYSTSTTSDPPDKKGQNAKVNEFESSQEDTPDFASVESKQEGLLDEEIEDFYREDEVVEEEVSDWVPPISLTSKHTSSQQNPNEIFFFFKIIELNHSACI